MKIILIIIGACLCSISLFFFIIYLNILTCGYTFLEFGKFIIRRFTFWLMPIGIILIYKGLERKKTNELLL